LTGERKKVAFKSGGVFCRGVLCSPETDAGRVACIVMGHGFGGTMDAGLFPFAERYVAAGFCVLAFDYRHFGVSDGEPRQLLSVRRQLEDWAAAIAYARTVPGVDPDRVGLFGTSFSGGHVVAAAAADSRVAAVVAQCPMMDGLAALGNLVRYAGMQTLARISWHGLRDALGAVLGRAPHRVPIVGKPGSLAAMTSADAEPGYLAIAPPGWRNEVCARIGLTVSFYRPGRLAGSVRCPMLIQICEKDSVAPVAAAESVAKAANAEVKRYPVGHFDVYLGEPFEQSVSDQVEFFTRRLMGSPRDVDEA
jgi:pimeloyl-ACP methyl ester carboxylesterase